MLKSLHIENIAVIEQTDIDFSGGFNVLTGETGAGKSIVIDAINVVLGERTSKEIIRTGCDYACVSALFCDLSDVSLKLLRENGYNADEDGNLLVVRKLTQTDSTVKINGQAATVGILKAIGRSLVNIHGQHDNQALLRPENHCVYIDRLADNKKLIDDYYKEFRHLNNVRKELAGYETDEAQKQRDISLLEYEIKELTDAELKPGEADEIKKKIKIAQNAENTKKSLETAYSYLNGDDLSDGAFSAIRNAQKEISSCKAEEFSLLEQNLNDALAVLDETAGKIRNLIKNDESFGVDVEALRERLDYIYKITLKYGGSEQSAISYLAEAIEKLDNIKLSDKKIIELSAELDDSTKRLISLGEKLTESRIVTAGRFENEVTEILKFLNMPNVEFKVKIIKGRYTKIGCDEIEFMISANAGEGIKPLSRIASGGELSRVMLAIKSVLADKDDVDTLIFDEIDSGISGRTAGKVGYQLKKVSADRQTLCVTHLAQIAAFGQNHLLIEKSVNDNRTYTLVKTLTGEERVMEIARIMAGSQISENIINSARELLERTF